MLKIVVELSCIWVNRADKRIGRMESFLSPYISWALTMCQEQCYVLGMEG